MQKNDLTVKVVFLKREQSMHCNQEDNNHFLIYMVKKNLNLILKTQDFLIYNQKNHVLYTFNSKIIIYFS